MLLAAMLAMVMVAAAPALAQATAVQYDDSEETNINTLCNQVFFIAAQQVQYGDANAAAVDQSEAAAAAANELGISINAALACFESAAAAGDVVITEEGLVVVEDKVYEEIVVDEKVYEEIVAEKGYEDVVVHEDVVVYEDEAADDDEMAVLPDTGGASLLALGAGALLVGGGLLARRIFR